VTGGGDDLEPLTATYTSGKRKGRRHKEGEKQGKMQLKTPSSEQPSRLCRKEKGIWERTDRDIRERSNDEKPGLSSIERPSERFVAEPRRAQA